VERVKDGAWKEDVVMKGIETVRRDWCELTGETMREIIEILLKHNDVKEAVRYFKGVVDSLLSGKIDMDKLVITKTVTKRPEAYVGVQPHVEVIKKMRGRNALEIPGVGDRIGYVIVKGTQLLSKRAEDPAYAKEKGILPDSQYYIGNQLMPPLERIFGAIGVDREELLGMGKQMGIAEAINNHKNGNNGHGKVVDSVAPLGEVDGFVCQRCSRPYRRPPLIGRCECGGSLLFSSASGPVAKVRVS
jgi:DNA polymerase I